MTTLTKGKHVKIVAIALSILGVAATAANAGCRMVDSECQGSVSSIYKDGRAKGLDLHGINDGIDYEGLRRHIERQEQAKAEEKPKVDLSGTNFNFKMSCWGDGVWVKKTCQ